MKKTNPIYASVLQVIDCLKNLIHIITATFSNKKRLPELQELEDQFTKDTNLDLEKLRDRQISTTLRSGRG
jgi:hypothetical protein